MMNLEKRVFGLAVFLICLGCLICSCSNIIYKNDWPNGKPHDVPNQYLIINRNDSVGMLYQGNPKKDARFNFYSCRIYSFIEGNDSFILEYDPYPKLSEYYCDSFVKTKLDTMETQGEFSYLFDPATEAFIYLIALDENMNRISFSTSSQISFDKSVRYIQIMRDRFSLNKKTIDVKDWYGYSVVFQDCDCKCPTSTFSGGDYTIRFKKKGLRKIVKNGGSIEFKRVFRFWGNSVW